MRARLLPLVVVLALSGLPWLATPMALADTAAEHHEDAAAHSSAHGEGHHAPSINDLLFPAINFSIYLFIIMRYVRPALLEFLRRRHSDVVRGASEAGEALARAEKGIADGRARLAALPTEADGIRRDLVEIAKRQAERLKTEAEETGRRRLADAAVVADQERRRALEGIRAEIAGAATTAAERTIREKLTGDDQRAFVQKFLQDAAVR
jgi:F-type H+-transporting ATPase subunit b